MSRKRTTIRECCQPYPEPSHESVMAACSGDRAPDYDFEAVARETVWLGRVLEGLTRDELIQLARMAYTWAPKAFEQRLCSIQEDRDRRARLRAAAERAAV